MKAIALKAHGLDHVSVVEMDPPEPGPHEVIVRMRASALNHLDLWTLSGALALPLEFPHVLGADGAGDIEAVGSEATGLRAGMRVLVNPGLSCRKCEFCRAGEQSLCTSFRMIGEHRCGTLAELVSIPATNVYPYPGHLSPAEAAALGVTFITGYRMLFTRGRLRPGEWIAITGIGGGLALSLFQLARPMAGKIFVTSSSPDKLRRAAELGATGGIDYTKEDPGKGLRRLTAKRGVDALFDSAGGAAFEPAMRGLRKGGRLVTAGATAGATAEIDLRRLFWNQVELIGSTMGSDQDVADMLRYVSGNGLRPIIDRTFDLDQGSEALAYLDRHDHFGKVVIEFPG